MVLLGDEAQVDAYFGLFGDSANLVTKIGAWFVPKIPQARKSFWTHLIEHLGGMVMWNLILVCLEVVLVSVQDSHGLRQMYHRLRNTFGCTRWNS
jgi:hypothetical protein